MSSYPSENHHKLSHSKSFETTIKLITKNKIINETRDGRWEYYTRTGLRGFELVDQDNDTNSMDSLRCNEEIIMIFNPKLHSHQRTHHKSHCKKTLHLHRLSFQPLQHHIHTRSSFLRPHNHGFLLLLVFQDR